jgi:DNA-binding transcriptional ArsR family regulator
MKVLQSIFPQARIEVLQNLLLNPEHGIYLREITRQSGLSLGAVQHELANLVAAELITTYKDGNRQYYKANREHPIYSDLREIFIKCDYASDVLKEALSGVVGVRIAFIFGSVAKKTEKARSDLDVMIIGSVGLRTLAGVLRPVSERLQREVNPYVLSPQTWRERLKTGDNFISTVEHDEKIFIKGDQNGLKRLGK